MNLIRKFKIPFMCVVLFAILVLNISRLDISGKEFSDIPLTEQNVTAYGIFLDSNEICVLEREDEAEDLVNELLLKAQNYYGFDKGYTYLNSIKIKQGSYKKECVDTTEKATELLGLDTLFGKPLVKKADGEKIQINLCRVSLEEKYVETEFETEYRFTYGVSQKYEKVLSEGKNGLVKQVFETKTVNGDVVSNKLIAENTVSEPNTHVIELGVTSDMQLMNTEMAYFIKPYDGIITSRYGYRYLDGYEFHTGIDLVDKKGSCYGDTIVAAADGVVVESGYLGARGNYVLIKHEFGFSTMYMHLKERLVSAGDTVVAGDPIGKIGSTGRVTGPHLHFEIRLNGKHTNPENYLKFE